MWPILARLNEALCQVPFVCGVYCGSGKPTSTKAYFEKFVTECCHLKEAGIVFESKNYLFDILCMICDAPARSFCKGSKQYSGYHGCDFCKQEGFYLHDAKNIVFMEVDCPSRLDSDFLDASTSEHVKKA